MQTASIQSVRVLCFLRSCRRADSRFACISISSNSPLPDQTLIEPISPSEPHVYDRASYGSLPLRTTRLASKTLSERLPGAYSFSRRIWSPRGGKGHLFQTLGLSVIGTETVRVRFAEDRPFVNRVSELSSSLLWMTWWAGCADGIAIADSHLSLLGTGFCFPGSETHQSLDESPEAWHQVSQRTDSKFWMKTTQPGDLRSAAKGRSRVYEIQTLRWDQDYQSLYCPQTRWYAIQLV